MNSTKKIFPTLLCIGIVGTFSFIYQDWIYEKYLDFLYTRSEEYFIIDNDGYWISVENIEEAKYNRVSWLDENNKPVAKVKIFYAEQNTIYWIGQVTSLNPFLPNGICFTYFLDGALRETINYENGIMQGEYQEYYNSGNLKFKGNYVKNQPDSICMTFYPNGLIKEISTFDEGSLNGMLIQYDTSGNYLFSGEYSSNLPNGKHIYYHSNTVIAKEVNYFNGILHGPYGEYNKEGNPIITGSYKDNLAHGVFISHGDTSNTPNELYLNDTLFLIDVNLPSILEQLPEQEIRELSKIIEYGNENLISKDFEVAIKMYSKALKIYPNLKIVAGNRGEAYFEMAGLKDQSIYQRAEKDILDALHIDDNRRYWRQYMYGICNYYQGSYDDAMTWLEFSISFAPENESGQTIKALSYNQCSKIHMENKNFTKALESYNKAIELDSSRSDFYLGRAWTHLKLYDNQAAKIDCAQAISIGSESIEERAESYSLMARLNYEDGNLNQAEYWTSKSLKSNPADPYSLYLFDNLYPSLSSTDINSSSFGQFLVGASVALLFWEATTIYRLLLTGRVIGAATEIAGSVMVGSGVEILTNNRNASNGATIKSTSNYQIHNISDLNNASILINRNASNVKFQVSDEQKKMFSARNFQSTTNYRGENHILTGRHIANYNYYQVYHLNSDPWGAWNSHSDYHDNVDNQVFLAHIDYIDNKWQFISSSHSTHDHKCRVIIDNKFPKKTILKAWSEKLKLIDIDHSGEDWVLTFRNDCSSWFPNIKEQFLKVTYEFPEKLIKAYWENGYFISKLKFIDNKWVLLMEKYKWNTDLEEQRVLLENYFPIDEAYDHEQIGYNLQSAAFGRGLWAVVVSKKE